MRVTFCRYCGNEMPWETPVCPTCKRETPKPETMRAYPRTPLASERPELEPPSDPSEIECPDCAEIIRARAKVCRFCGYDLVRRSSRTSASVPAPVAARRESIYIEHPLALAKSSGVAVLLSFFWPGLGQVYAGRILAGLCIMFLWPVFLVVTLIAAGVATAGTRDFVATLAGAYAILLIANFIFWIWNLYDAYQTAETANRWASRPSARRRSIRAR